MSEPIKSTTSSLLGERREPLLALQRAVAAVPGPNLGDSLQAVADELPLAISADFANVRLLGPDGRLYLVAASGCTPGEVRKRVFEPLEVDQARAMLTSGAHEKVASTLGIRWAEVVWAEAGGETIAAIGVGSRTKRTPGPAELAVLQRVCDHLAAKLKPVDRTRREIRRHALALAKRYGPEPFPPGGRIADLRPRERVILELFADGLTTVEIADLLVISPHTVRTHVKLALRRLGARSRDEAATMVRADQMAQLV